MIEPHIEADKGRHKCKECNTRFRTARQLVHHVVRKHKL